MDSTVRIDALMDHAQTPARYIGGEMNAAAKPWEAAAVRFAFCFPDLYEIGMSHLGMKILYEIINAREDALCERVFAPAPDMADAMRAEKAPLFSLETRHPVRCFDIVGFTLQYEMSYTTILEMLDLSGIPLLACERRDGDPIVIAGGPCAYNPEPLHAFIDVFTIGDGEESTEEVLDAIKASKAAGESREACLHRLAQLEGMYVPAFYDVSYHEDGTIRSFTPNRPGIPSVVRKRVVEDLDAAPFPEKIVVPFQEIVHDRIMLEVMRGCTRGCRFCQAGMLYRPVRERTTGTLLTLAEKLCDATGYEEISLSSLSTGDYSNLAELVRSLNEMLAPRRVSLSLPSLRLDNDLAEAMEAVHKVRKTSLTFAPEAGTQRLRDVINKGISEQDLERTVRDAFLGGTSAVKLYFMIGLPTETDDDIQGIIDTVQKVSSIYFSIPKGERPRGLRITVGAAPFVPKPFTPFQWAAQDTLEMIDAKQDQLFTGLRNVKGASYRKQQAQLSLLEACFARGDRRLSSVLLEAFHRGCRLDGWSEHFRFDRWKEAFDAAAVSMAFYANRKRDRDEHLPWDFIDAGITKAFLWREKERSEQAVITPDCRQGCQACGLMDRCFPENAAGGEMPCE